MTNKNKQQESSLKSSHISKYIKYKWILYLDWGGSYTSVYICQNSPNCGFKVGKFYFCKLYLGLKKWEESFKEHKQTA